MDWIRFERLERYYGARPILAGAGGALRDHEKIGLVGANGSGKSTLLRILAGGDAPDRGMVTRASGARVGYVAQDAPAEASLRLREVMESAFAAAHAQERVIRDLEAEIAAAAQRADAAGEATALRRYADAREAYDREVGADFEARMRSMLAAFGLESADLDAPMSSLSGGQRTRASIARALLEEPDYLLLDEPTNHLDVDAVRYLEDLIARDPRAMIVVSHDRYFLDRVASTIWELERGRISAYPAPRGEPAYTVYVEARRRRDEEAQRRHELLEAERKRRRDVIAELRTHGSHNYAQVRSREKMLGRMTRDGDAPAAGPKRVAVRLTSARARSRGFALSIRGLTKRYASELFAGLDLDVARGERIAVVGPNGSGKSTLLNVLAGRTSADAGVAEFATGVLPAYFSQESSAELRPGARAVDIVVEAADVDPQRARALLGRVGLGGDRADKDVDAFSGGERRRIMIARLMSREADCLLLDEPTNDLDIDSREALESALDGFAGAMLVVSHDRYLLRRVADRVLWLHEGSWTVIDGGYDEYERMRASPAAPAKDETRESRPAPPDDADVPVVVLSKNARARLESELAGLEDEISRLTERRHALERAYADPELYVDPARVKSVHAERETVRAALERATRDWDRIVETLDAAPS